MATPLTRQDLVAITDQAKNKILDRLMTRSDMQNVTENARDRILNTINAFHVESQVIMRQSGTQNDHAWRRIAVIESQVGTIRQELRVLTQIVNRLYDIELQQVNRARTAELAPLH